MARVLRPQAPIAMAKYLADALPDADLDLLLGAGDLMWLIASHEQLAVHLRFP